eukprot:COSAG01_NODE_1_length_100484_cov_170.446142_10_plen_341_part_00
MTQQIHTLIIGQGIAGTMLAFTCIKQGLPCLILDPLTKPNASQIAAGLVEPISGKRWTLAHEAARFIPFAKQAYLDLEQTLGTKFLNSYPTWRLICDDAQAGFVQKRLANPAFKPYLSDITHTLPDNISCSRGAIAVQQSFSIRTQVFLHAAKQHFLKQNNFLPLSFDAKKCNITPEGIVYQNGDIKIKAKSLVFCQGHQLSQNPYFKQLDFRPSRGDVLTLHIPKLTEDYHLVFNKWLIPMGKQIFKYGASYDWPPFSDTLSEQNHDLLLKHLDQYLKRDVQVLEQNHGYRCHLAQATPIMQVHPEHKRLFVLGGLGSKGFMSAPFLSHQLYQQHLIHL